MNMLSGQEHPDVLWQLENFFFPPSYFPEFRLQKSQMKLAIQEAVSTVQLAVNVRRNGTVKGSMGTAMEEYCAVKCSVKDPTCHRTHSDPTYGFKSGTDEKIIPRLTCFSISNYVCPLRKMYRRWGR